MVPGYRLYIVSNRELHLQTLRHLLCERRRFRPDASLGGGCVRVQLAAGAAAGPRRAPVLSLFRVGTRATLLER